jgi:hypothetical protein
MKLIKCHDCGNPVALTATTCTRCGSRDPIGPLRLSTRDRRRFRIEERNDRTMVIVITTLGAIGVLYGVETSSSSIGAAVAGLLYGLVGMAIGLPLAFAMNILRFW